MTISRRVAPDLVVPISWKKFGKAEREKINYVDQDMMEAGPAHAQARSPGWGCSLQSCACVGRFHAFKPAAIHCPSFCMTTHLYSGTLWSHLVVAREKRCVSVALHVNMKPCISTKSTITRSKASASSTYPAMGNAPSQKVKAVDTAKPESFLARFDKRCAGRSERMGALRPQAVSSRQRRNTPEGPTSSNQAVKKLK